MISLFFRKFLDPGESFEERVTLTPRLPGTREVIANFSSRELIEITGAKEVKIGGSQNKPQYR